MSNKGYVTIFVSLMLVVMIVVMVAVMQITDQSQAKTKIVTATSSAMSSELASYNRCIFDRYHILLLDKNCSGQGEGALEQDIEETMKVDLGEEYEISSVELSGTMGILDDDAAEFKRQINDNFKYETLEYTVDKILDVTDGNDEPVTDQDIQDIDNDVSSEQAAIEERESKENETSDSSAEEEEANATNPSDTPPEESSEDGASDANTDEEVVDPRDTLKTYMDAGIANILLPEDVSLSENIVSRDELPSYIGGAHKGSNGNSGKGSDFTEVDTDFDDLDQMELDTTRDNKWASGLLTNMEAIMYSAECFNCLTEQKYDDTYLNLEMEYIVGGEDTDGANYKKVVNEILLIRFGFNFAYILTDSGKTAECEALAAALTVEFPPAEPVVKYLLMGCWSYIESIADVYLLLRGYSVPYWKTFDTWTTDFESLGRLEETRSKATYEDDGLGYKEYLMILMALQGDKIYYRMLDLIQLNVSQPDVEGGDPSFRMSNAITAFGVNVNATYKGKEYSVHEESGY